MRLIKFGLRVIFGCLEMSLDLAYGTSLMLIWSNQKHIINAGKILPSLGTSLAKNMLVDSK